MPWQMLAVISLITVSFANVIERYLMRNDKSDPFGYAIVFQLMLGVFSFIAALLFGRWVPPNFITQPINWALTGILWAGSTIFSFMAIKRLSAGETTILFSSSSLISIILGVFLLNEIMKLTVIAGAIMIFMAILILYSGRLKFTSRSGVVFSLIGACFSGMAVINDVFIVRRYEAFSYSSVACFLPGTIILLMFFRNFIRLIKTSNIKFYLTMAVFCIFYTVQMIAYYLAYEKNAPITQLSLLIRSSVVVTVILGAVFLKEKENLPRKILAALVMIAGVLLVG